jgi:hypothetical protein
MRSVLIPSELVGKAYRLAVQQGRVGGTGSPDALVGTEPDNLIAELVQAHVERKENAKLIDEIEGSEATNAKIEELLAK